MSRMNRIAPAVPAHAYQTYAIRVVPNAKGRRATCAEIECAPYVHGWVTRADESTELGQAQAHYIRHESGRPFREERESGGLTSFTFAAGTPCFQRDDDQHWTHHDDRYLVRGGDWRGNPSGQRLRVHTRPEFWVEDFAENQDRIHTVRERG